MRKKNSSRLSETIAAATLTATRVCWSMRKTYSTE
nr:MAG TPA_asm: hypothetical protein [Caudoviricetes sp.]